MRTPWIDDVINGIRLVGWATGKAERAESLAHELAERIAKVRRASSGLNRPAVFALEWADPPYSAGHWIPEMIQIAGGRPVLGEVGKPSHRLLWPEIAAEDADVVVFMPCGYSLKEAVSQAERLFTIPEFSSTPAARKGRVFAVDASSHFSRPGPRLVYGLEILFSILHPSVSRDLKIRELARVRAN